MRYFFDFMQGAVNVKPPRSEVAVAFLASPEAGWVNGQNILINGVSILILSAQGLRGQVSDLSVKLQGSVVKNPQLLCRICDPCSLSRCAIEKL